MELPNITIGKIKKNEEAWNHLLDDLEYRCQVKLSFEEKIIMGEYCNTLQIHGWREMEQEELIIQCILKLQQELKNIRL